MSGDQEGYVGLAIFSSGNGEPDLNFIKKAFQKDSF
jgi:hypothetical protein